MLTNEQWFAKCRAETGNPHWPLPDPQEMVDSIVTKTVATITPTILAETTTLMARAWNEGWEAGITGSDTRNPYMEG